MVVERSLRAALFTLFFIGLASAALTQMPLDALNDTGLEADVKEKRVSANFTDYTAFVEAEARITNNNSEETTAYLFVQNGQNWVVYKKLGAIPPEGELHTNLSVTYSHWNEEITHRRYALVTETAGVFSAREFTFTEEWEKFLQENIRNPLAFGYALIVPILAFLLGGALIGSIELAYKRKDAGAFPGEYTVRTLLFPKIEGRPIMEKLADALVHPGFWVIEMISGILLISVILTQVIANYGYDTGSMIFVIAAMAALAAPVLYAVTVWLGDKYEREPLRFIVAAFLWGVFAALLAFLFNTMGASAIEDLANSPLLLGMGISTTVVITGLLAPTIEEIVKGIGVFALAGHHEMDDATDGLLYGFVVGLGFAFIENLFYFAVESNPLQWGLRAWIALILYRGLFNSLAHGCFTAAIGGTMGFMKSRPHLKKYYKLGFLPGLFIAIVLHALFNIGAILDTIVVYQYEFTVFIFNPILVVVLGAAFIVAYILANADTKNRVTRVMN